VQSRLNCAHVSPKIKYVLTRRTTMIHDAVVAADGGLQQLFAVMIVLSIQSM